MSRKRFLMLQQPLPFTVLKRNSYLVVNLQLTTSVATALTVYGIETALRSPTCGEFYKGSCNSPYRLRY